MAKQRSIQTSFWDDAYIIALPWQVKAFFMYLLTNPLTEVTGVYEISIRHMQFHLGLGEDDIVDLLTTLQKDNKIMYRDGWVAIKNWAKHQNTKNKFVRTGIDNGLGLVPAWAREYILSGVQSSFVKDEDIGLTDASSIVPDGASSTDVQEVFEYWQHTLNHTDCKFSSDRQSRIKARLKDFTVAQLKRAVDGVLRDDWLMGRDPKTNGKSYTDIQTVFRDVAQVEKLIKLANNGGVPSEKEAYYKIPVQEPGEYFDLPTLSRGAPVA